jgi:uncharacterized protein (TIGR02145 family)
MKKLVLIVLASLLWVVHGSAQETGTVKDSRDGRTYKTVKIGDQWWIAENLGYLPEVSPSSEPEFVFPPSSDTLSTEKFYYVYDYQGTNISKAKATDIYIACGVLYNFEAATTACMAGWHLPSDEEWKVLEKYLGMNSSESDEGGKPDSNNWRNSGDVGKKLKSISGWIDDGNGNNSSGFIALPGSERYYYGEGFGHYGQDAIFWSSTKYESSDAWPPFAPWYRMLGYVSDGVWRGHTNRNGGFSIRCLKD